MQIATFGYLDDAVGRGAFRVTCNENLITLVSATRDRPGHFELTFVPKPGSGVGSLGPLFITSVGIGGLGLNNGHLFVRGVNTSPDGHVQFIIEAEGLHIPASSGDVSLDWNWYQGVNTSFHFLVVAWDATEGTAGFSHPGTEGPFPKIP